MLLWYQHIHKAIKTRKQEKKYIAKAGEQLAPYKNDHKHLSAELVNLKQNKEKLYELYISGKLNNTKEVIEKINKIDMEIVEIDNKLKQYEDTLQSIDEPINFDSIKNTLNTFASLIDVVSREDKKMLIRSLINEIKLTKDRTIDYIELKFSLGGEKVYRF